MAAPCTSPHIADAAATDKPSGPPVVDFYRSFLTFRMDLEKTTPKTVSQAPPFTLNNARFLLECVCRMTPPGKAESDAVEFVLSRSCKAEQVHVTKDIWHDPAADMCLVASREHFLVLKSWDRNNRGVMLNPPSLGPQPERQVGLNSECFTDLKIALKRVPGRLLSTTDEIVDAVLSNRCLVSQSEYSMADGTRVLLEYPINCINASEREKFYQVDTGPVLLPDRDSFDGTTMISMLRQAFMAHNTLGCTELLMNVPTPLGHGISVNHYSRVVCLQAVNRMYSVD
ncbi:MAG: hypothetical protein ACK526_15970 [Planctomyces sp.]